MPQARLCHYHKCVRMPEGVTLFQYPVDMAQPQAAGGADNISHEILHALDPSIIINDMHDQLHLQPSVRFQFLMLVWQHVHHHCGNRGHLGKPHRAIDAPLPAHIQPAIRSFLITYGHQIWPDSGDGRARQHLTPTSRYSYNGYWNARFGAHEVHEPYMSLHGSEDVPGNSGDVAPGVMVAGNTSSKLDTVLRLYFSAMLRLPGGGEGGIVANTLEPDQLLQIIVAPQQDQQQQQQQPHPARATYVPQQQQQQQQQPKSHPAMPNYADTFEHSLHKSQLSPAMATNPWAQSSSSSSSAYVQRLHAYLHPNEPFQDQQQQSSDLSTHQHQGKPQPRAANALPFVPTIDAAPTGRGRGKTKQQSQAGLRWTKSVRPGGGPGARLPFREEVSPKDMSGQPEEGDKRGRMMDTRGRKSGVKFGPVNWGA